MSTTENRDQRRTPARMSRRTFLKITLASTVASTAGGVGLFGYMHDVEPDRIEIKRVTLTLPRLAPAFDGYRVAQFSDIHIGRARQRAWLDDVVAQVNAQNADLIAFTGDFVDHAPEFYAQDLIEGLSQLHAPDGVITVLGNHDYWTNAHVVREIVQQSGLVELRNEVLILEREGALHTFAGVDDVWERHARLDDVLDRVPGAGSAILLAHEPDFADTSAATGRFDLQISGHSHGGQVIVPLLGPPVLPEWGRKYPVGRYQVRGMIQYTNRGVGMIPPEVRFNCRPEITVYALRSPRA